MAYSGFTIPHQADALAGVQAEPDKGDFHNLARAMAGNGVVSGLAVSQRGAGANMSVDVAVGLSQCNGRTKAKTSITNLAVTAADATNPRLDLVTVALDGTLAVTTGTAAAAPVYPAIPDTAVLLAVVYVPAGDSAITSDQITDKRLFVRGDVMERKTVDEAVNASIALQDDDALQFDADASSTWWIWAFLVVNSAGARDIKVGFTAPSGATLDYDTQWEGVAVGAAPSVIQPVSGSLSIGTSSGGDVGITLIGRLIMSTTPGTVHLQWAQVSSGPTDTTVRAGSILVARRCPN